MTTHDSLARRSGLLMGACALLGALSMGAPPPSRAALSATPASSRPLNSAPAGSVRILWSSTPPTLVPGSSATFNYRLIDRRSGRALTSLPLVHEKPMHLILVSRDLTRFQHIHPQVDRDGTWRVRATLDAGPYVLYTEFFHGGHTVLDRREITVGQATAAARIAPDLTPKLQQGVRITLAGGEHIVAGRQARLIYRLTRAGRPVRDLIPYLGAAAHVAIVSRDTHIFTHTHGEIPGATGMAMGGMEMGSPPAHFGPEITVTHTFPRPGLYKIWAQFGYHGHVLLASAVVRVY